MTIARHERPDLIVLGLVPPGGWTAWMCVATCAATRHRAVAVIARSPGRPFTFAQLRDLVYDEACAGYDRAIGLHVKNLRRKIEPDPVKPRYILTVCGVGYKMART